MTSLQELREMILDVLSDREVHTRSELIDYAKERYSMSYYDAERKVMSAVKSLIKKGDLLKPEKGVYQLNIDNQIAENTSINEQTETEQQM